MEPNIPAYYAKLENDLLSESIRNFDDPANLDYFSNAVSSARSRNFFIDFGDNEAWSAFDLDASAFLKLIKSPRPASLNTRWINIWLPHNQTDLITVLARYYDFTPRLLGFMCSKPVKPAKSMHSSSKSGSVRSSIFRRSKTENTDSQTNSGPPSSTSNASLDAEEQIGLDDMAISPDVDLSRTLNQYSMASDLWHYSTMDWGRRFVCLGYNTLHVVEQGSRADELDEFSEDLPNCKRVWSWLLLCEDKTVITIHEHPYPFRSGPLSHREQRNLGIIRRNLINVFRQCSKARDPLAKVTPLVLPLRIRVGDSEKEEQHRASDVPGLLFYYLFDDWLSIYTLIARRDNHYAQELNNLRMDMLSKAELRHVDRLHHLGNQLGVLKRLYQGYSLLVVRLLGKREVSLASLQNSHVVRSGDESLDNSQTHLNMAESHSILGVGLSSAAKVRFQRLQHRLQLYAENEVQECLAQKDSLVMVNFNLLAIKESLNVERLTEVTLLLAKVTLLFMPVSLLTAYFSCQFVDYQFSYKAYWKWFAGVFVASILCLATFTLISGTSEGRIVTKPMSRRVLEFSGKIFTTRRRRSRYSV